MGKKAMGQQFGDRSIEIELSVAKVIAVKQTAAPVRDPDIQTARIFGEGSIVFEKAAMPGLEGVIVARRDKSQHLLEMVEIVAGGEL
jgi:hypothetical protein